MSQPVAHWVNAPGQMLASGASITVGVEASSVSTNGTTSAPSSVDPIDRIDYTLTPATGAPITASVSVATEQRFAETAGQQDPLTGCGAGEQVPVWCYPWTVAMASFAPGAFTMDATVWPTSGSPRTLPTQRHWNNKDSALSRVTIHLDGAGGNDANNGLTSGASKLTMRGAMAAGIALAAGGNLGLVDIQVHNASKWNDTSGIGGVGLTATCGTTLYCHVYLNSGATLSKDGDWINRPHFNPGSGNRVGFWFHGPGKILGKLRTTLDSGTCDVVFDHTVHTPHSPWDGDASNPYCGAYDEGRHGLFWLSSGEPAYTAALGCDISGMELPFSDRNTLVRGCKIHKGYGVMLQLAGGTTVDTVESNVCVVSSHVEDWRHSTGDAGASVDAPRGYLSTDRSGDAEGIDNGSGKLRIIETAPGNDFYTAGADLVGSTTIGLRLTVSDPIGGGPSFTVAGTVIGTGNVAGNNYIDLDLDGATYGFNDTSDITLLTVRVADDLEWSSVIHSDVVKLNAPTVARNFTWRNVSEKLITSPRHFGLDSHLTDTAIIGGFSALCGAVQNDDIGAAGYLYVNVLIQNHSFAGTATLWPLNTFFDVEIRDCVFSSLTPGGGGTLDQLNARCALVNNHFVVTAQARGAGPTTGTAFSSGTPGLSGDARLSVSSTAIGSASGALDRSSLWFLGNRGAEVPSLQGDFTIPSAPVTDHDDLNPLVFEVGIADLSGRAHTHVGSITLVRPIWPAGALDTGFATGATGSTLTDASKAWTTDQWKGYWVKVRATNAIFNLKGNTATRLDLMDGSGGMSGTETFDAASLAALGAGGGYDIGPTGPAVGLQQLDDPWTADNPVTGEQDAVPKTWTYPAVTPGSPEPSLDEIDLDAQLDVDARLTGKFAKRGALVTRLSVRLRGVDANGHPYDYDVQDFLVRAAGNGLGSSLGQAQVVDEFRSDTERWARMNPTHGGAEVRPHFSSDVTGNPLLRLLPSMPLPNGTFIQNGPAGTARWIGTAIPIEFITDGYRAEWQTYGAGDNNTFGMFARHLHTEAMVPFIGQRRFLHRIEQWYYDPDVYDETRYGATGEFLVAFGGMLDLVHLFDEAWFIDPITGTTTQLDVNAFRNNNGDQWQAFNPATGVPTRYIEFGQPGVDLPSPFSGGYGALVLRRTSDDFSIGLTMKMGDTFDVHTGRQIETNTLGLLVRRGARTPGLAAYDDGVDSAILFQHYSYEAPAPGWHCQTVYQFIGPWANAVGTVREAYTSGLLDDPADVSVFADVPDVLTGTDLGNLFGFDDLDPLVLQFLITDLVQTGGLAFVVEDGTGLEDANSYASVSAADDYFEALGNPSAWAAATTEVKEAALRVATREMDLRYAQLWTSLPKFPDVQRLAHPQGTTYDLLNRPHTSPPLPEALVQACCEAALREVQVPGSLRPTQPSISTSGGQTLHAGPFSFTASSGATVSAQDAWSKIDQIMRTAGLIISGNWALR